MYPSVLGSEFRGSLNLMISCSKRITMQASFNTVYIKVILRNVFLHYLVLSIDWAGGFIPLDSATLCTVQYLCP